MNKEKLKVKILFLLFAIFLIISAILFNFEKMLLAIISYIIVIIFALLLVMEKKEIVKF